MKQLKSKYKASAVFYAHESYQPKVVWSLRPDVRVMYHTIKLPFDSLYKTKELAEKRANCIIAAMNYLDKKGVKYFKN